MAARFGSPGAFSTSPGHETAQRDHFPDQLVRSFRGQRLLAIGNELIEVEHRLPRLRKDELHSWPPERP
jgi:hypothetical protein